MFRASHRHRFHGILAVNAFGYFFIPPLLLFVLPALAFLVAALAAPRPA